MRRGPKPGTIRPNPKATIGTRYGRLVINDGPEYTIRSDGRGRARYPAICDCGTQKTYLLSNLTSGVTQSCGCLHREVVSEMMTTHGATRPSRRRLTSTHGGRGTRLYRIWKSIRQRCNNPNATNYRWYGGKGIRVCREWDGFTVFRDWALANGYTDDLTIERRDASKDYQPENCEWITASENARRGTLGRPRDDKGVWIPQ